MFHPTRPPESWSRLANWRARLYGSEYEGRTLREHYGLPFPAPGEATSGRRATRQTVLAG